MMNLSLPDPKRRVLGWFSFDSADSEVLRIHPDPTAVHKFVRQLWLDSQNIWATCPLTLVREHGEIIILAIESNAFSVCGFKSFAFGFEQPLQYVIYDPLGPTFGKDLKLFRVWSLVPYFHNHFSMQVFGEPNVVEPIRTPALVALQGICAFSIFPHQSCHDLRSRQSGLARILSPGVRRSQF